MPPPSERFRSSEPPLTTSNPNRRLTARRACRLSVRYRVADDWHPATAMDISLRGCRLRVGESLARGQQLRVLFEVPLHDGSNAPAVEVSANVIWSRVEGISYQAGLAFAESPRALEEVLAALA
jgi:hypothetical protein